MVKNPDNVKRGKKARLSGAEFERRTRFDLENKRFIVSKWQNNVEFTDIDILNADDEHSTYGKPTLEPDWAGNPTVKARHLAKWRHYSKPIGHLIPAKASRFRLSSTGYPDYFCYRLIKCLATQMGSLSYDIIFVEVKTNGYLDKIERKKARWYLDNNYCSKFLIASKQKIKNRVKVIYTDFEEKYGKEKKQ